MSSLPLSPPVRWIVRHVLIVLTLTVVVSLALVAIFNQPLRPTLIYCFFISLCCAASINLLRYGLGWIRWRLLNRFSRAPAEPFDWPGWPLMVLCLVLGTLTGYSLGLEAGNMVTGLQEKSLLSSPLRRVFSVMVIALIPGFGATLFFLSRHRIAAAEARAETLRRQAAETQLRLLESQLEPHMLFNTLANLRVLIGMDAGRAQAMLDHLIAFLRATLSGSRAERHPLKEEFARIADYLALMQVAGSGVDVDVADGIGMRILARVPPPAGRERSSRVSSRRACGPQATASRSRTCTVPKPPSGDRAASGSKPAPSSSTSSNS